MINHNNYVVIMAGGVGSRFWPFSRTEHPKQFHDVLGVGKSLLQLTIDRFKAIVPNENVYIVTNKSYKNKVKEQLPFLDDTQILLEEVGKSTAPCIAYATHKIHTKNPEAKIIVAPSDHVILKENVFEQKLLDALEAADLDVLVTLGIKPTRPDTGYGYIQFDKSTAKIQKVKRFAEKPNIELAKVFVSNGDYVWNAGIFIWKATAILQSFKSYLPELDKTFASIAYYTENEQDQADQAFIACDEISIDYGVMEKAENVYVVLSDIGWSDLGTWKSLYEVKEKDDDGNVIDGDVMVYDAKNCIIKTPKDRLVVVHGVKNLIIAEYDNVLMICDKDEEQKVKDFVKDTKALKDKSYY